MTELSRLRGSEGYADCDDAGVRGRFLFSIQKKASQEVHGGRCPPLTELLRQFAAPPFIRVVAGAYGLREAVLV